MEKNAKTILAIIIVLAVVLLTALGLGIRIGRASVEPPEPTIVRDTIRETDTVRLPAPPPDTVTLTKIKTVKVPLHDTVTLVDSVWVDLPFEQHFARLDSVADVWYSGYDAKIDSAIVYKHRQTIIEQHYITPPAKPNIIGLEAGAKDASLLYIHRFGKVHVGFSAGSTYEGQPTARGFIGIQF